MSRRYVVLEINDNQIGICRATDDWLDAVRILYKARVYDLWIIDTDTCDSWNLSYDAVKQAIKDFQWYMLE